MVYLIMMFDMFATLGFMQNRQNGPLAHGAPWRTAQAAHSTRLLDFEKETDSESPRAARGRAPCASVLEPHHKSSRSRYLRELKKALKA